MKPITRGTVTIQLPDNVELPADAGMLSGKALRRLPKARPGASAACLQVAEAMRKHPERLCPPNLTPEALESAGKAAEWLDGPRIDLRSADLLLSQADVMLHSAAHDRLRMVLAFVRGQEKFDPRIIELVPCLVDYFARKPNEAEATAPAA